MPDLQAAPRLREHLLTQAAALGHSALLGPRIHTLSSWIESAPAPGPAAVQPAERELILAEALQHHPDLFGDVDLWVLCASLVSLFDELSRHQCQLPKHRESLIETLRRGYGVSGPMPEHLSREAMLVHSLWNAWRQQLHDEGKLDPNEAHAHRLQRTLETLDAGTLLFAIGLYDPSQADAAWFAELLGREQAELIVQAGVGSDGRRPDAVLERLARTLDTEIRVPPAADDYTRFMDAAFAHETEPMHLRAQTFAAAVASSPLTGRLTVFHADHTEHEARAVDLQVRRWLLGGKTRIGIVTEDRRLARRLRALLERSGVELLDSGGWALSTTSAATVIERWLQAVEEDFAHQPLMDLLKSPFLAPPDDADAYRLAVYRLEQDIVRHENIARGLSRYRRHALYRARRLQWPVRTTERIIGLLDTLEAAARPLSALHAGGKHSPDRFLEALTAGLEQLNVRDALDRDAAGYRVLEQIEQLRAAARTRAVPMGWAEFRSWLGRAFEGATFRPPTANSPVQLLTLSQSQLGRYDALVIAGAERNLLPGPAHHSPYFNDGVRRELGLPGWHEALTTRLYQFRRLLESSPRILISRRREQDGEEIAASPWLQVLEQFHRLAYGHDLGVPELHRLLADPRCEVVAAQVPPRPTPQTQPRARADHGLLPQRLSVSAHQRLLNCPYLFFAADCLGLKPLEEIREALEKSDYGERVHRCLEAFHGDVADLPGPFTEPVTAASRQRAIECLSEIARLHFAQDLEDNFMHRGWLKRWLALIPSYIDWQIQRQTQWTVQNTEVAGEVALGTQWRLKGRVDRVDSCDNAGRAIIDYKTGAVPAAADVTTGEAVQLPCYALLVADTRRVEYLKIDGSRVESASALEGEELAALSAQVGERLQQTLRALSDGAALPAWGDEATCSHCPMGGICRRQAWHGQPENPSPTSTA